MTGGGDAVLKVRDRWLGGRALAIAAALACAAGMLSTTPAIAAESAATVPQVKALSGASDLAGFTGADFDPGYIISDANFYDPNSMTAEQVQAFLASKVSTCTGSVVCLKDLRVDTWNIAATPMCAAYQGAPGESAATIIYKVGRACGVSQAVILVMLQKEQGLITNPAPSLHAVSAAMGVGCYDNGQPCLDTYSGFFNQLFNGAFLLRRYTQPAGTGPGTPWPTRFDLSYPVGQTSNILYHPNRDCGTRPVAVRNQATHALYVYTPYTPNGAAVANLTGTGDGCSSYGNRNFWRLYSSWFGDPTTSRIPMGWLDAVGVVGSQITAKGWAFDADTTGAIRVEMTIDGTTAGTAVADGEYPGLENSYPAAGSRHAFSVTATSSPGSHQVCLTAINDGVGNNRGLGCRTVTVAARQTPIGWLDSLSAAADAVTAVGWTIDSDTPDPISIAMTVDGGTPQTFLADRVYPGFGNAYPGFGDAHGFEATVTVPSGTHNVCVLALDNAGGASRVLTCRSVTIVIGNAPIGWLDAVDVVGTTVTARGWTFDADTRGPIDIQMTIDGVVQAARADRPYPGLGGIYKGYGDDHGFGVSAAVSPGSHTVCIKALDNAGGAARVLGCRTVQVSNGNVPIGWIDSIRVDYQKVVVAGWAIDPDTADAIQVTVTVNGQPATTVLADVVKPGLGSARPGFGDRHAFIAEFTVPVGVQTICVTPLDSSGGVSGSLGCRSVTGVSQPPFGWVDGASVLGATVTVRGWAFDKDTAEPITVRATFDGSLVVEARADVTYAGLGTVYPGYGDAHGFAIAATLAPGAHTVCLTAVNNTPSGRDQALGCKTFTTLAGNTPIGWLDEVQVAPGSVTPLGWALDPDTTGPINVDILIDGVVAWTGPANTTKVGLGDIYRGFGSEHGFAPVVSVGAGSHQVCVIARNNQGPTNGSVGCRTVSVP